MIRPLPGIARFPRPLGQPLSRFRPASTLAHPVAPTTALQLATKSPIRSIVVLPLGPSGGAAGLLRVDLAQRRWASSHKSGSKSKSDSETEAKQKQLANTSHSTDESGSKASQEGLVSGAVSELRGVASGVADIISGGSASKANVQATAGQGAQEISSHSHSGSVKDDFMSITRNIFQSVPQPALMVGLAGTIPYLGTSLGTIFLAREAARESQGLSTITGGDLDSILANLHMLEHVQITYGAIILSFLGAIHWGMEFAKLGGEQGYKRLALGVIPVLFAWPTTFLPHGTALVAQWFGFTGTWFLDQKASTMGWTTPWYATYRFYLSLIVGFSIIATFAGTGYYGAGAGATIDAKGKRYLHTTERVSPVQRVARIHEAKHPKGHETMVGRSTGEVKGDVEVDEEEDSDHYLTFRNKKKEKEKEEEEAAEAAEKEKEEKEKEEGDKEGEEEEGDTDDKDKSEGGSSDQGKQKAKGDTKENEKFQDQRDQHQQEKAPGSMKSEAKNRTGENEKADGKDTSEKAKQGAKEKNEGKK